VSDVADVAKPFSVSFEKKKKTWLCLNVKNDDELPLVFEMSWCVSLMTT